MPDTSKRFLENAYPIKLDFLAVDKGILKNIRALDQERHSVRFGHSG